jgi:broad specificity phosphatase PhoE/ribonuclease HI
VRLIVEADGGSRGNPGPAGYGSLVRDAETGAVLARRNGFLGTVTNNVAEYTGLIEGLKAAQRLDPAATVEVRMDSKLVVEQVSGRWQVKHPSMKPLAREAVALAATFPSLRLTWVPRAQNGPADALANEAMDARAATYDALDDAWPDTARADADEREGDHLSPAGQTPPATAAWGPVAQDATTLLLLRHGQTPLSVERRFSGRGNPALTETGLAQARAAAERLATTHIDAVVSSPLTRAMQTAETVAARHGVPVVVDHSWVELDFGSWEGLTYAEVRERDPEGLAGWLAYVEGGPDDGPAPHGGETFAQCTARVRAARDALVAAHPGKAVLVVSHVTPIKAVAGLVLGAERAAMSSMFLDLCGLSQVLQFADGRGSLRSWNETSFLPE